MAVTGQQVYDAALVLMDEVIESGAIAIDDPEQAKTKAKSILTMLQADLLPLSTTPTVITDLSQDLLLSDRDALLILPYGLAAHMLINEESAAAPFYNDTYQELKRKRATSIGKITDVYGLSGVSE